MKSPCQGSRGKQVFRGCHSHFNVKGLSFGFLRLKSANLFSVLGPRNATDLTSYLPLFFITH